MLKATIAISFCLSLTACNWYSAAGYAAHGAGIVIRQDRTQPTTRTGVEEHSEQREGTESEAAALR